MMEDQKFPLFERPDLPIWRPEMQPTKEEMQYVINGMEQAEKTGFFDGLFKPPEQPVRFAASKEQLLESIRSDMKLTKDFFRRTYGYEITRPGFAELVISKLEAAGCSKAREYYEMIKNDCDQEYDEMLRPAARDYVEGLERKWKQEDKQKEGGEARKMQVVVDN